MIRGEKVLLRALESTDAERLHAWLNDSEVTHWLGRRLPTSLSEVQTWADERPEITRALRLGITDLEGALVGWCDLARGDPIQDNAMLTVCIGDRAAWGQGMGTDATLTLCGYGFAELNFNRITLYVFAAHTPAVHVYEKCGFVHEGCLREGGYRHGARQDLLVMGLLREDFKRQWPDRWAALCR